MLHRLIESIRALVEAFRHALTGGARAARGSGFGCR